jgi:hypothetical protein
MQRARDALALTRAFLLLEDGESRDWEVGGEEPGVPTGALAAALREPAWAPAHRASPRERKAPRRGGQPAAPPQVCLSPIRKRNILHRPNATASLRPVAKVVDLQVICGHTSATAVGSAGPPSHA